jgi:hypothetical protein
MTKLQKPKPSLSTFATRLVHCVQSLQADPKAEQYIAALRASFTGRSQGCRTGGNHQRHAVKLMLTHHGASLLRHLALVTFIPGQKDPAIVPPSFASQPHGTTLRNVTVCHAKKRHSVSRQETSQCVTPSTITVCYAEQRHSTTPRSQCVTPAASRSVTSSKVIACHARQQHVFHVLTMPFIYHVRCIRHEDQNG